MADGYGFGIGSLTLDPALIEFARRKALELGTTGSAPSDPASAVSAADTASPPQTSSGSLIPPGMAEWLRSRGVAGGGGRSPGVDMDAIGDFAIGHDAAGWIRQTFGPEEADAFLAKVAGARKTDKRRAAIEDIDAAGYNAAELMTGRPMRHTGAKRPSAVDELMQDEGIRRQFRGDARETERFGWQREGAQLENEGRRLGLDRARTTAEEEARQRQALGDPASLDSQVIRALAERLGARVPDTVTGGQLLRVVPHLEKAYQAEMRAQERNAVNEDRDASRGLMNEQRQWVREQRERDRSGQLYLGRNWEPGPRMEGARIPEHVRSALMDRDAATDAIGDLSAQLRGVLDRSSTVGRVAGRDATELSGIATQIQMQLKNAWGLGVLNGKDLWLLEKVVQDPTNAGSILRDATSIRDLRTQIATLERSLRSNMAASARAAGYVPAEGSPYAGRNPGRRDQVPTSELRGVPRGAEVRTLPDGRTLIRNPDGTREVRYPDGRRELRGPEGGTVPRSSGQLPGGASGGW